MLNDEKSMLVYHVDYTTGSEWAQEQQKNVKMETQTVELAA